MISRGIGAVKSSPSAPIRLRQQSAAELKNGGGARDVFGSWLQDGHSRRGRELLLDRDRKMAEDASGRLTG